MRLCLGTVISKGWPNSTVLVELPMCLEWRSLKYTGRFILSPSSSCTSYLQARWNKAQSSTYILTRRQQKRTCGQSLVWKPTQRCRLFPLFGWGRHLVCRFYGTCDCKHPPPSSRRENKTKDSRLYQSKIKLEGDSGALKVWNPHIFWSDTAEFGQGAAQICDSTQFRDHHSVLWDQRGNLSNQRVIQNLHPFPV